MPVVRASAMDAPSIPAATKLATVSCNILCPAITTTGTNRASRSASTMLLPPLFDALSTRRFAWLAAVGRARRRGASPSSMRGDLRSCPRNSLCRRLRFAQLLTKREKVRGGKLAELAKALLGEIDLQRWRTTARKVPLQRQSRASTEIRSADLLMPRQLAEARGQCPDVSLPADEARTRPIMELRNAANAASVPAL